MDYIGSSTYGGVGWLFALVALSIIQWILIFYYVVKDFDLLGEDISSKTKYIGKYKKKISFMKDYFFHFWNIYPIILYLFFHYLELSWSTINAKLFLLGGAEAESLYNVLFRDYRWIDYLVLSFIIALAFLSTFGTQNNKQKQYKEQTEKIYWWDIRLNKKIYWIRFVFLFFNMILVGFISYLTVKITIYVLRVLSLDVLLINPFHPDGYGGTRIIIEIITILLSIYFLRAAMGIIGFFDHSEVKDKAQFLGDLYHASYLVVGMVLLVCVVEKINAILTHASLSIFNGININHYAHAYLTAKQALSDGNSAPMASLTDGNILVSFSGNSPIDFGLLASSLLSIAVPIGLLFVLGYFKQYSYGALAKVIRGYFGKLFWIGIGVLLMGALAVFVLYAPVLGWIKIHPDFSIAILGYFGLLFIPIFMLYGKTQKHAETFSRVLWVFFSALVLFDLPKLFYVTNGAATRIPQVLDSWIYILSVILLLFLLSFAYFYPEKQTKSIRNKNIFVLFSSAAFTMAIYHASNYYMKAYKHIPNTERSIFINGLEFHHINLGILALLLAPYVYRIAHAFFQKHIVWLYIFLGITYGTVVDECWYYAQGSVTDQAYFDTRTIAIQVIILLVVSLVWVTGNLFFADDKQGKNGATNA